MFSEKHAFLGNAGEMGSLLSQHDWAGAGLAQPAEWPMSLKSIASIMLRSRFPMFLAWGERLTFIYNDAYAPILGGRHPAALGCPFQEVRADIWERIAPIVAAAMQGDSSYFENMPLTLSRNGQEEMAWFTFSYSPIFSDEGAVCGMYCVCSETTGQVLANRSKDDILSKLAHELRNPFSAIQAAAEVLRLGEEADAKTRKAGDIIVRQVAHLSSRLDNLLEVSDSKRESHPLAR
jgi:signal transduction histidine kinase